MVKSNHGDTVITGSLPEIIADISAVLKTFREKAAEEYGMESAEHLVRESIRLSFMSEKETIEELKKAQERKHEKR